MYHLIKLAFIFSFIASGQVLADTFTLTSTDIAHGQLMSKQQEYKGFGCNGENKSPQLAWSGAPKETQAFAIFAYDPDAPTGSGWWHWQVLNIPKEVTSLAAGVKILPKGSHSLNNDYSDNSYGGACPPKGHGVHHYQFTVYALSKEITLPANASSALAGYMVQSHTLASSTIEALYQR